MEFFIQNSQDKCTASEFAQFEMELLVALGYQLKLSTPYDLLEPMKRLLPMINKKHWARTPAIIDFALSIACLSRRTSEEIFYGSLLYCAKKSLDEMAYELIFSQVLAEQGEVILGISHFIEETMNSIIGRQQ